MPYVGSGPRIQSQMPKRKKASVGQPQGVDCTPLMMSLMACYKAHKYDKTKCEFEQERLMKCTMSQSLEMKKKDSSRYHLMRLLRRIRR